MTTPVVLGRLEGRDGSLVSEAEIPALLPDALVFRGRVFLRVGWEGPRVVYREVLAHLLTDTGEIQ